MGYFDWITIPTSYHNVNIAKGYEYAARDGQLFLGQETLSAMGHSPGRPNFGHLTLLVFEAIMQVVCVSLPGYIVARQGFFDAEAQKFLANLNLMLFTPCLIFTKLASQLTAERIADLAIIPVIFLVQTLVSYLAAITVSRCFAFRKRQKNFVIAMAVFGNSNSLPISLVLSLSQTLRGLHWNKLPHDDDNEVGARGILYLLIFQQLGQLLRWSWGFNVLLAPADKYLVEDGGIGPSGQLEEGLTRYQDEPEDELDRSLLGDDDEEYNSENEDDAETRVGDGSSGSASPGLKTPNQSHAQASSRSSRSTSPSRQNTPGHPPDSLATTVNGDMLPKQDGGLTLFPNVALTEDPEGVQGSKDFIRKFKSWTRNSWDTTTTFGQGIGKSTFQALPSVVQSLITRVYRGVCRFGHGVWQFMNPPLWAMLVAIFVASVPSLQWVFFTKDTFIHNSVTRAVSQSAGVAVPLILVVLGGNLARNTLPKESAGDISDPKEGRNLLIASLVSRMVLPIVVMAPLLALIAKYVPVSIVDDKIFVIVCFLLTGAPTALQLAQICQINNVYMGVMSKILFQSYVIWILPSTLILVLCALLVVDSAGA